MTKKQNIATFLVSILLIATLPSCLKKAYESGDGTDSAQYGAYVTIYGNYDTGYTFLTDEGAILYPTSASITSVLPELTYKDHGISRARVTFSVVGFTPSVITPGEEYTINLVSTGYESYIETRNTIELYDNREAIDTLEAKSKTIYSIDESLSRIANGYINLCINYSYFSAFTMDLAINSQTDVDVAHNTITFTFYYDSTNTSMGMDATGLFSFLVPDYIVQQMTSNIVCIKINGYGPSGQLGLLAQFFPTIDKLRHTDLNAYQP
ncbi:MAG: hypothetical protein Q4E55_02010 [Bacteroidales bacterium]|nr:hypothetical protein [Bacteroidales bacterium]